MKESNLKISHVALKRFFFEKDDAFKEFRDEDDSKEILSISGIVTKNTGTRQAEVTVNLSVFEDFESPYSPFKCEISYLGEFFWDESLDGVIDNMLKINAPATIISYIRPILSQFTMIAGLPILNLPLLDFTNPKSMEKITLSE